MVHVPQHVANYCSLKKYGYYGRLVAILEIAETTGVNEWLARLWEPKNPTNGVVAQLVEQWVRLASENLCVASSSLACPTRNPTVLAMLLTKYSWDRTSGAFSGNGEYKLELTG